MSKRAKEAALKAYPNVEQPVWDESYPKTLFVRHTERNAFVKGYEQAEKDLALTWGDMKLIDELFTEMAFSEPNDSTEWYQELADRFNSQREKK